MKSNRDYQIDRRMHANLTVCKFQRQRRQSYAPGHYLSGHSRQRRQLETLQTIALGVSSPIRGPSRPIALETFSSNPIDGSTLELDIGLICVCALLLPSFWNRVLLSSWRSLGSNSSTAFGFHKFSIDTADSEHGLKLVHVQSQQDSTATPEPTVPGFP